MRPLLGRTTLKQEKQSEVTTIIIIIFMFMLISPRAGFDHDIARVRVCTGGANTEG
jgi:hypothetical protein